MQVFKSYFKIFNKYKGQMLMYLGIFIAVLSGFVMNNNEKTGEYISENCLFAIYDYDNTKESKAMVSFLAEKHEKIEIEADDTEVIQDELFNRNIHCLLRIPKGFSNAILAEYGENVVEVVTIPGTKNSMIFESDLDQFVNNVIIYIKAGYSSTEAIEKTVDALSQTARVSFLEGKDTEEHNNSYIFFNYLGWVLMCMVITAITPTLIVYNKKEIQKRIVCSSYSFSRINMELFCGVAVVGVGICGILMLLARVIVGEEVFSTNGIFYMLNMFCYMLIALAVAFLVSKITDKDSVISMISNVISLGMAFLCGVFVPMEYLGENVVKFAHFLPAFWYTKGVSLAEHIQEKDISIMFQYMGVEVLFAVAIFLVALVVSKGKKA